MPVRCIDVYARARPCGESSATIYAEGANHCWSQRAWPSSRRVLNGSEPCAYHDECTAVLAAASFVRHESSRAVCGSGPARKSYSDRCMAVEFGLRLLVD